MRYKATVQYDGSLFLGWQIQAKSPTVQECIEDAISKVEKKPVKIVASGRTDRGVNALGQVFHFDSELNIPLDKFPLAINNQLVDGIFIQKIEPVKPNFHARFDALWKYYRYSIEMGEYQLFERNQVFQYNKPLNIENMQKAAHYLIGTHDFSSFNSNSFIKTPNQIRTLYNILFQIDGSKVHLNFYGDGFMRYMVRMITGTLIEVGRERIIPEEVYEMLLAKDKEIVVYNAKPEGLTLVQVEYEQPMR